MLNFTKLRAPPGDGEVLIEPPAAEWPGIIAHNMQLAAGQNFLLGGVPVQDLRRSTRECLVGHGYSGPIVACGHQPAFVHPGVWAKHAAVRATSQQLGFGAFDLVVDNDAPHSPGLTMPEIAPDGLVAERNVEFWRGTAGSAHEGRPPLTPAELDHLARELQRVLKDRFADSAMPAYLEGLGLAPARDGVDQHLAGRDRVDRSLGVNLREVRVSSIFGGPFVAELLLNAPRFAAVYNVALHRYRDRENVRSPDRPLPDLRRNADRVETALWVYRALERRRRLWVQEDGGAIRLFADDLAIGVIGRDELLHAPVAALGSLAPWVIRPRALTLTLWARLLACDLFVHGIGGAKYDRITDEIFKNYFGCEPPGLAAVSATLRLPLPHYDASEQAVLAARRALRDLHYNPQRYLPHPAPEILANRDRLISESELLRERRAERLVRRAVFLRIREINALLLEGHPGIERQLEEHLSRLIRECESNRIAESREFFYALQPVKRLQMLARRVRDEMRMS